MEPIIPDMDIHGKLKAMTDQRRIKAEELGKIAGAGRSTAYDWLNGKSSPSLVQSLRIARTFGVPLEWLADDDVGFPPPPARSDSEQRVLRYASAIGIEDAVVILDSAKNLGAEKAKLRLLKAEDAPSPAYSAMNTKERTSLYTGPKDKARSE